MHCVERWIDQHNPSVGQRKKYEPQTGIEPHYLLNTGRALYPLSYENS